jgi:hypothetical protein
LLRIVSVVALICSITFLFNALPSNATISTSSNTQAALDNATSLNQTLPALVNQTLPALVNQTLPALVNQSLISLNETATEQARLIEEARENITQSLISLNETATEQARLIEEAKQNASAVIKELGENATGRQNEILRNATGRQNEILRNATVVQNEIYREAVRDLPTNLSWMLGIVIISVIAVPLIIDMVRRRLSGEEKTDFYRALMTFGVIIVVGLVVIYLIALINVNISTANVNVAALIDVLKNLSTILGTALAAIVAFYFGTRIAQRPGEGAPGAGTQRPGEGAPGAGTQRPGAPIR